MLHLCFSIIGRLWLKTDFCWKFKKKNLTSSFHSFQTSSRVEDKIEHLWGKWFIYQRYTLLEVKQHSTNTTEPPLSHRKKITKHKDIRIGIYYQLLESYQFEQWLGMLEIFFKKIGCPTQWGLLIFLFLFFLQIAGFTSI